MIDYWFYWLFIGLGWAWTLCRWWHDHRREKMPPIAAHDMNVARMVVDKVNEAFKSRKFFGPEVVFRAGFLVREPGCDVPIKVIVEAEGVVSAGQDKVRA